MLLYQKDPALSSKKGFFSPHSFQNARKRVASDPPGICFREEAVSQPDSFVIGAGISRFASRWNGIAAKMLWAIPYQRCTNSPKAGSSWIGCRRDVEGAVPYEEIAPLLSAPAVLFRNCPQSRPGQKRGSGSLRSLRQILMFPFPPRFPPQSRCTRRSAG